MKYQVCLLTAFAVCVFGGFLGTSVRGAVSEGETLVPDVVCPFSVDVYPDEISLDAPFFIRLTFENTLDRPAFAPAETSWKSLTWGGALEMEFDVGARTYPLKLDASLMATGPLGELPWKRLAPNERTSVSFLVEPAPRNWPEIVRKKTANGEKIEGRFRVVLNDSRWFGAQQRKRNFFAAFSEPFVVASKTDAPQADEKTAETNAPAQETSAQKSARLEAAARKEMEQKRLFREFDAEKIAAYRTFLNETAKKAESETARTEAETNALLFGLDVAASERFEAQTDAFSAWFDSVDAFLTATPEIPRGYCFQTLRDAYFQTMKTKEFKKDAVLKRGIETFGDAAPRRTRAN